jgi:hypothetical protein
VEHVRAQFSLERMALAYRDLLFAKDAAPIRTVGTNDGQAALDSTEIASTPETA